MADFYSAFNKLTTLEYKSCKDMLHWNKGEEGYTFMGLYEKYHKNLDIWQKIRKNYSFLDNVGIIKEPPPKEVQRELSEMMCMDDEAISEVARVYKDEYWNIARLDDVNNQKVANNIFIFGVNAGMKTSIIKAQRVVQVKDDGIVGKITLKALNEYNPDKFVEEFKEACRNHYLFLVNNRPEFSKYIDGWLNRVERT